MRIARGRRPELTQKSPTGKTKTKRKIQRGDNQTKRFFCSYLISSLQKVREIYLCVCGWGEGGEGVVPLPTHFFVTYEFREFRNLLVILIDYAAHHFVCFILQIVCTVRSINITNRSVSILYCNCSVQSELAEIL